MVRVMSDIVDKIKKMLAHEASARKIGSVAEASAFAERIQELMLKHKLRPEDLGDTDQGEVVGETVIKATPGGRYGARRTWWRDQLMHVVAEAHFCRSIVISKTNLTSLVGRDSDRAITLAMYAFLLATMRRLAAAADRSRRRRAKTFRTSFYHGFIKAIWLRWDRLRSGPDTSVALVLKRSSDEIDRFLSDEEVKTRSVKSPRFHREGFTLGLLAGREVSLSSRVIK